jgi:hypothetical protein
MTCIQLEWAKVLIATMKGYMCPLVKVIKLNCDSKSGAEVALLRVVNSV